jgi:CMP-N-acetylneuraminic acid synthetase
MRVAAYVPMKLNNERLPNKNTRAFDNGRPLLSYIFETLAQVDSIDAVHAYCSNPSVKEYLPAGVRFVGRSPTLDRASTPFNEVMRAFAAEVTAEVYVLAHATAPFITAGSICAGVDKVLHGGHDSALSVKRVQEFLWQDSAPLNYDPAAIPRTQDLPALFAETTGLYVYRRELIVEKHRRVGSNPYLIEVSKIEAVDINEAIDFEIANAIACRDVPP